MKFIAETENSGIKPVLLNYGGASKALNEMSEAELEKASQAIRNRAKEKAFSKGLPIYYTVNEQFVAEHADGRIVPVNE